MQRARVHVAHGNLELAALELLALLDDLGLHDGADGEGDVVEVAGLAGELDLFVLELAHLEHVVDERQQVVCRDKHLVLVLGDELRVLDMGLVYLEKADDAVERRADVVAHAA